MEFLLEIQTEEMPASHVKAGLAQLRDKLQAELSASHIAIASLQTFGTCRRLIVVGDFTAEQEDKEEWVVGPPRAVALGPDGTPSEAARGFARAQNIELEKLQVVQTAKGEYLGYKRTIKGRAAKEILAGILPGLIRSLSFPKMMRWGEGTIRFSRPIKLILCLFGGEKLVFSLDGLASSGSTTGHKFRAPQKIEVKSFRQYKARLKRNKVIIDEAERKAHIRRQIEKKLAPFRGELYSDDELLDKLAIDVEYPHVFLGNFPEGFLKLPIEVLSAAMREGQKLFSVVQGEKQLPYFLGVADTASDPKSLIRRGNERVLRARLEDARFFWEQDLKMPLAERAARLRQVVFQEKLGSYEAKTVRLKSLVAYLCDKIDEPKLKKDVMKAAELAKVDLLTEMVREFPALQGKVGGLYARAEGYPAAVHQAVYEHYQPAGLEDSSPKSMSGALLSLADKLDSIVGVVGIGIQGTGSSDPFGIRRNANGISKIVLDWKLDFSLPQLIEKAIAVYGEALKSPKKEIIDSCLSLFEQRLRFIYESRGYRYDLVNATLGAGIDKIVYSHNRLRALDSLQKSSHFEAFILMVKRVGNITRGLPVYKVNPDLFTEKEERELFSTYSIIEENVRPLISAGEFAKAQSMVFKMEAPLAVFFDRVLVMADDRNVRQNRLGLLQAIGSLLFRVADYSQVVIEGDK